MASITEVALKFFDACETGKGWEGCQQYCTPNATFRSEASPLAAMTTLAEYTNWMQGLFTLIPDGRYQIRSFATDTARNNVAAYGIFSGTHTGEGGPVPPTGKHIDSDYVYVMEFDGDTITHMTKIWNDAVAMKGLGWAA
jgi:predicted ester cyclase